MTNVYGYNEWDKNELYDILISFLETHPISELSQVVTDAIENHESSNTEESEGPYTVTDTWKVGGSNELNAWCPKCEHRITRGCSFCPTCGAKLEWSEYY